MSCFSWTLDQATIKDTTVLQKSNFACHTLCLCTAHLSSPQTSPERPVNLLWLERLIHSTVIAAVFHVKYEIEILCHLQVDCRKAQENEEG